ncbi:MAG: TerC family protein [Flavobacteriales bacterium]
MEGFDFLFSVDGVIAFLTLAVLEIVLGIDNLVFISIIVDKAPKEKQRFIRLLGLGLALGFRVVMLLGISFIVGLKAPIFSMGSHEFSWRDMILLGGGMFLIAKSTLEIHHKLKSAGMVEHHKEEKKTSAKNVVLNMITQIVLIDIIFSIDSILTAVGLTENVTLMISAVVISMIFMMVFSGPVGTFINQNPTIVMLALSFLLMIGMLLVAEAFGQEFDRGYVYFAMGFSLTVELLNLVLLKRLYRSKPSNEN